MKIVGIFTLAVVLSCLVITITELFNVLIQFQWFLAGAMFANIFNFKTIMKCSK